MRCVQKTAVLALLAYLSVFSFKVIFAQEATPFTGEVNANNINIRTDSTVASEVICNIDKGEQVEVLSELYGWYKIRLPKKAPSFIKKDLVCAIEDKPADSFDKLRGSDTGQNRIAKVDKDKVNIRLHPNESSAVLGKAGKNEVITILENRGAWYKIEPINNSFGWINNKFVSKASVVKKIKEEDRPLTQIAPVETSVTVEGIIRPYGMIIKRIATHKLVTSDNNIFLLKGNKKSLDALNYHKVKVIGKFISPNKEKFPVIEIDKVEGLD